MRASFAGTAAAPHTGPAPRSHPQCLYGDARRGDGAVYVEHGTVSAAGTGTGAGGGRADTTGNGRAPGNGGTAVDRGTGGGQAANAARSGDARSA
eukprot:gene31665-40782_t